MICLNYLSCGLTFGNRSRVACFSDFHQWEKTTTKKRQLKALPSGFLKLMMLFPEAVLMKTGVICWHLLRSVFVPVWVCVCTVQLWPLLQLPPSLWINAVSFFDHFHRYSLQMHQINFSSVDDSQAARADPHSDIIHWLFYNMSENINKYPETSNSNETRIKLVRVPEQRPGKICCYQ